MAGCVFDAFGENSPHSAESRIAWIRRQPDDRFSTQPYEHLAALMRSSGDDEAAKAILIAKNDDFARQKPAIPRLGWWILRILVGYGYLPIRAVIWSLLWIGLGTVLFRLGYKHNLIKGAEHAPVFSSCVFSIESFVPLVNLSIREHWQIDAAAGSSIRILTKTFPMSGRWLRRYFWLHICVGWVLTTLWIGALTGLVKT